MWPSTGTAQIHSLCIGQDFAGQLLDIVDFRTIDQWQQERWTTQIDDCRGAAKSACGQMEWCRRQIGTINHLNQYVGKIIDQSR